MQLLQSEHRLGKCTKHSSVTRDVNHLRLTVLPAIVACCRFLFFPKDSDDDDKVNPVDVLAKSDKNSFKSVAAVLRLGEAAAVGGRLSKSMFDMNDVKVKKKPPARTRCQY
jgi:hypothetical protein